MSVAFTKEDSAETASEILLPDRPVSPHPNLVTDTGLKALEFQLQQAREAYETAQQKLFRTYPPSSGNALHVPQYLSRKSR